MIPIGIAVLIAVVTLVFGLAVGTVAGAGVVVQRVREYRDIHVKHEFSDTEYASAARAVVGDLLTWLGS